MVGFTTRNGCWRARRALYCGVSFDCFMSLWMVGKDTIIVVVAVFVVGSFHMGSQGWLASGYRFHH